MTQEKISNLEKKQEELANQVTDVKLAQALHFQKNDELISEIKNLSTDMRDNSKNLAVMISQMAERHEFEKRMGAEVDKIKDGLGHVRSRVDRIEPPVSRFEAFTTKIMTGQYVVIVILIGVAISLGAMITGKG